MQIDLERLPDDAKLLQQMLRDVVTAAAQQHGELHAENDKLRMLIQRLLRHRFGRRSEQLTDDQETNSGNYLTETFLNNGQPNWILNPTGGVTAAQVFAGTVPLSQQTPIVIDSKFRMPYAWQSSIGFQKQCKHFEARLRKSEPSARASTSLLRSR